jgi:hypothetical protein
MSDIEDNTQTLFQKIKKDPIPAVGKFLLKR